MCASVKLVLQGEGVGGSSELPGCRPCSRFSPNGTKLRGRKIGHQPSSPGLQMCMCRYTRMHAHTHIYIHAHICLCAHAHIYTHVPQKTQEVDVLLVALPQAHQWSLLFWRWTETGFSQRVNHVCEGHLHEAFRSWQVTRYNCLSLPDAKDRVCLSRC